MRLKKYLNEGIGRLGLHLMKNPAGTYSFVGSVPVALGWLSKSGKELTPEEAKEVSMANMPAMLAKTRIFKTPQEAFKVAKKYGYKEKDISFNESLEEARGKKPAFGTSDGFSYAVNIPTLDSNEFLKMPFGRQLDDSRKVGEWKKTAKKAYVGAKGKGTLPSVKKWVKENKPSEFYAKWKMDSSNYKDDSVEIFYKK